MGGEGSGRKPDIIRKILEERRNPILRTSGDSVYLPNYSGLRGAVRKDRKETLNLVNGQVISVNAPTDPVLTFNSGSGNLSAEGYSWSFAIYAYRDVDGTRVYSSPIYAIDDDAGDLNFFYITLSWTAASGVDGYKIVVLNDDWYGRYGDYYMTATTTITLNYGDGSESLTNEDPMVTTPTSPYLVANDALTTIGGITTTGTITANQFESTDTSGQNEFVNPLNITSNAYVDGSIINGNVLVKTTSSIARLKVQGADGAYLNFRKDGATTNQKPYQFVAGDSSMWLGFLNDAENSETLAMVYYRSGQTPTYVAFPYKMSIGIAHGTAATAKLHIGAGTASANTAPIKLTSGTLNTTPEAGAIEFDGTNLYITQSGGTRKTIAYV
jgi:hypothetical protein